MAEDALSCGVCYLAFDGSDRRPYDLGCGHSFCEACLRASPRSFRNCPECRVRANNPHVNIALLRLVDARAPAATPRAAAGSEPRSSSRGRSRSQPPEPQPLQQQAGPLARRRSSSSRQQLAAAVTGQALPLPGAGGALLGPGGTAPLHATLEQHKARIAQWRTAAWCWLGPVIGVLYLLSPLDIIPDFLPIVGWLDDALVLYYIACSVWQAAGSLLSG